MVDDVDDEGDHHPEHDVHDDLEATHVVDVILPPVDEAIHHFRNIDAEHLDSSQEKSNGKIGQIRPIQHNIYYSKYNNYCQ